MDSKPFDAAISKVCQDDQEVLLEKARSSANKSFNESLSEGEMSISTEDDMDKEDKNLQSTDFDDYRIHKAGLKSKSARISGRKDVGFATSTPIDTGSSRKLEIFTPPTDHSQSLRIPINLTKEMSDGRPKPQNYTSNVLSLKNPVLVSDDSQSHDLPKCHVNQQNYFAAGMPSCSGACLENPFAFFIQNNGSRAEQNYRNSKVKANAPTEFSQLSAKRHDIILDQEDRLATGVVDPTSSLAALEQAQNVRQQVVTSLQVQLSRALERIHELEEKREMFVQNTSENQKDIADSLMSQGNDLKNSVAQLKDAIVRYGEKLQCLKKLNFDVQHPDQSGENKKLVRWLKQELTLERSCVETLKGEINLQHQQNQKLLNEVKRQVQITNVLRARLETAFSEISHKDRLLGLLQGEISQDIQQTISGQQLFPAQLAIQVKKTIQLKEEEIQAISEELVEKEKKVSNLIFHMKSKDGIITELSNKIKFVEELIVCKNKELVVKRQQLKNIIHNLKATESDIAQKVNEKEEPNILGENSISDICGFVTKSVCEKESEKPAKESVVQGIQKSIDENKLQHYVDRQCPPTPHHEPEKLPYITEYYQEVHEKPTEKSNTYIPNLTCCIHPESSEIEKGINSPKLHAHQSVLDKPKEFSGLKITDDTHQQFWKLGKTPQRVSSEDSDITQSPFSTEQPFGKSEMTSKQKVETTNYFNSVCYTQNTNIDSLFHNTDTDTEEKSPQFEIRQVTDLKLGLSAAKNEGNKCNCNSFIQEKKKPYTSNKTKRKLVYPVYSENKYKVSDPHSTRTHSPVHISIEDSEKWQKNVVFKSPNHKNNPVLVNINVKPQPLVSTEFGEHFVCDLGMTVHTLPNMLYAEDVTEKTDGIQCYSTESFRMTESPQMGKGPLKSSGTYLILNKNDTSTLPNESTQKFSAKFLDLKCTGHKTVTKLKSHECKNNPETKVLLNSFGEKESPESTSRSFLQHSGHHTKDISNPFTIGKDESLSTLSKVSPKSSQHPLKSTRKMTSLGRCAFDIPHSDASSLHEEHNVFSNMQSRYPMCEDNETSNRWQILMYDRYRQEEAPPKCSQIP